MHAANGVRLHDARMVDGLFTKKSGVRGAGHGLFTRHRISKNTIIGVYTGRVVNDKVRGDYVMQCGRGRGVLRVDARNIDALDNSALRYANTAGPRRPGGPTNNARITGAVRGAGVVGCNIRSTKNIPAGSEIFIAYGRSFNVIPT